jgi:hypothetical protein
MNGIQKNLTLIVAVLLIVVFALITRGCYNSTDRGFRDTVRVTKVDTVFQREVRVDTLYLELEKIVRVEVPTIVEVEVPIPSDTVYLNDPNLATPRVYSDSIYRDGGVIWYRARTIGFMSGIELGYKANVITTNTTVTNSTTINRETTETINLNRSRLYLGLELGVSPASVIAGTSSSNIDLFPSLFWGNQTMGVRVGYGLLNGSAQVGYFRKLTLFERK